MRKCKRHLLAGLVAAGLLSQGISCTGDSKTPKPNIILILVDDLGYGDLGCYGQSILSTPHIDSMAAEGIIFTNHYAGSTVCAPSRASLLSGLHTGNTSVRANFPPQLMGDDEPTLASILKRAGYYTGAIGKWGIGHPPPPDDPWRKGFDHFYGYINMYHAHNFYPEFLYRNGEREFLEENRLFSENGKNPWEKMPEGTGVAEIKGQHAHFLFDNEALRFIENNKDTTFFLFLCYNVPHANNEAGEYLGDGMEVDDYGYFTGKSWPAPEKGFAQMTHYMDESVGKITWKLKKLGIDENTLVIFTSDNGPHSEGSHSSSFFQSSGKLRGEKRDLYEGGIRVPFIARWPAKIPPASKSDHLSAFWDYIPTFCEIAGVTTPGQTDGISFVPALTGNLPQQQEHNYLYWEFYESGGKQAVRKGHWKAVRLNTRTGNPATELYNLENDPSETQDLSSQYPEKLAKMEAIMEEAHTPASGISLFNNQ
jgi:arylsulfatase A-like enzyme